MSDPQFRENEIKEAWEEYNHWIMDWLENTKTAQLSFLILMAIIHTLFVIPQGNAYANNNFRTPTEPIAKENLEFALGKLLVSFIILKLFNSSDKHLFKIRIHTIHLILLVILLEYGFTYLLENPNVIKPTNDQEHDAGINNSFFELLNNPADFSTPVVYISGSRGSTEAGYYLTRSGHYTYTPEDGYNINRIISDQDELLNLPQTTDHDPEHYLAIHGLFIQNTEEGFIELPIKIDEQTNIPQTPYTMNIVTTNLQGEVIALTPGIDYEIRRDPKDRSVYIRILNTKHIGIPLLIQYRTSSVDDPITILQDPRYRNFEGGSQLGVENPVDIVIPGLDASQIGSIDDLMRELEIYWTYDIDRDLKRQSPQELLTTILNTSMAEVQLYCETSAIGSQLIEEAARQALISVNGETIDLNMNLNTRQEEPLTTSTSIGFLNQFGDSVIIQGEGHAFTYTNAELTDRTPDLDWFNLDNLRPETRALINTLRNSGYSYVLYDELEEKLPDFVRNFRLSQFGQDIFGESPYLIALLSTLTFVILIINILKRVDRNIAIEFFKNIFMDLRDAIRSYLEILAIIYDTNAKVIGRLNIGDPISIDTTISITLLNALNKKTKSSVHDTGSNYGKVYSLFESDNLSATEVILQRMNLLPYPQEVIESLRNDIRVGRYAVSGKKEILLKKLDAIEILNRNVYKYNQWKRRSLLAKSKIPENL